jgi:hypothetical protein
MSARLSGNERTKTAADLRKRYEAGGVEPVGAFATGHSYCRVRSLLLEAGTTLRQPGVLRGGAVRSR